MDINGEVTCRPPRALWFFVGLGTAGAGAAVVRLVRPGRFLDMWLDVWLVVGLLLAVVGLASLHWVTAAVRGDAYGLHYRTLLRRRSVPWSAVADLRVRRSNHPKGTVLRVGVALRDGRKLLLPLPYGSSSHDEDFHRRLEALRALLLRHGAPRSGHLPVVSNRTAGYRGPLGPLVLCALLLACAGVAAWFLPGTAARERAWKSAAPCATGVPAPERRQSGAERGRECLSRLPAVVARVDAKGSKQQSRLHFARSRPLEGVGVSWGAAQEFRPGDEVRLTVWRGEVVEVAGEDHVWRAHVPTARAQAVLAAASALTAGWPGALALRRSRGRRLPDDEVLPSALPFAGALAGTALWLLPLCYLFPTSPLSSTTATTWAAVGSLLTLGLAVRAWRTIRVRTPEATAGPARAATAGAGSRAATAGAAASRAGTAGATAAQAATSGAAAQAATAGAAAFLPARFLEHTDYNPYGFGTHIALAGDGAMVTPHPGPGLFAAKRIPVERLTLTDVRRARGGDGDTVPRGWHIAELDDAGRPVRLAAAPADLTRVLGELGLAMGPTPVRGHHATP
ncbi:PH domain-containing protein [Streptomyces sp. NPDC003032]